MSNNTIILKRSSVTGKKPTATQLQYGELSINYADGEIYYKSSGNTIKAVGQQYATDIAALKSGKLDASGTAIKATSDASGNNIANTYIKGLSVSGKTITYTKGNGDTGTITTQDTTYGAATSNTLGLVKVGSNITNTSGTISLTKENVTSALGYTPPTTNTTYSSMTGATASTDGKGGLVPTPIAGQQASYLRGDGTWAVPANTTYSAGDGISLSGTKFSNSGVRSIASGTTANTLTVDTNGTSKTITIDNVANATKATQDSRGQTIKSTYIKGLSVNGKTITYTKGDDTTGTITTQDTTYGAATSSVFGLVKTGSNITNSSGTISLTKDNVVSALGYTPPTTNTTYSVFGAASASAAGSNGLVPAPAAGKQTSFLRGDGTWVVPTNTTYSAGEGIGLSGTTFSNSGVRSITAGSTANVLSVNTGGTTTSITINNVANASSATNATQLATARTIDGVSFNGTANIVHYGSCATAAATVEKVVDCTGFTLATGSRIIVKFTVTNTAASPTLNVNSTGAKAIYYRGAAISKGYLAANRTYEFVYNGTQYELVGDINTDTNTKVTQSLTSTAAEYSILGMADAAATATKTNGTRFSTGITMNPSTNTITATTFKGALSGNAATATKATQDASGNTITSYYAPKASPALTGTPTAPTAAEGTNTTQIATTAFVQAAMNKVVDLSAYAKLSGATFTGAVTIPNLTVTQKAKMPVIVEYESEVTSNYTISKNSMSSHHVEIADNVTVTIEDGVIWSIGC